MQDYFSYYISITIIIIILALIAKYLNNYNFIPIEP